MPGAGQARPYWTCGCGAWTWATTTRCSACGRNPPAKTREWLRAKETASPPLPPPPRSADGGAPTSALPIGEWLVQPKGGRAQAKARRYAEQQRAAAAADPAGEEAASPVRPRPPRSTQPGAPHREASAHTPPKHDRAAADQDQRGKDWLPSDVDEETVNGWLQSMRSLPKDEYIQSRIDCLEKKLEDIRSGGDGKSTDSAVQLLRAQSLTKKRERQRAAAVQKAGELEQHLVQLQAERDEALLTVERAGALLDEAKEKERALRAGLAAPSAGEPTRTAELALNDLLGLQAQLQELPAAMAAGNMDAAHGAVLRQTSAIIERLIADVSNTQDFPRAGDEYAEDKAPAVSMAVDETAARPTQRDGSEPPAEPAAAAATTPQGRPQSPQHTGERADASPGATPVRSRSGGPSQRPRSKAASQREPPARACRRLDELWGAATRQG